MTWIETVDSRKCALYYSFRSSMVNRIILIDNRSPAKFCHFLRNYHTRNNGDEITLGIKNLTKNEIYFKRTFTLGKSTKLRTPQRLLLVMKTCKRLDRGFCVIRFRHESVWHEHDSLHSYKTDDDRPVAVSRPNLS